ncbi:MAG: HD-GYP domain-containing protein [Cyanobacteria bacterium REEB65]|nr:HD-GYP domain-containing protein [Cyanobacteria bacterium REEB65]
MLGRSIFTADGRVLLREGTKLTARFIAALRDLGFSSVYVRDPRIPDAEVLDLIPDVLRQEAIAVVHRSFGAFGSHLKGQASGFKQGFDVSSIESVTTAIIESLMTHPDLVIQLADLKSHDNYAFAHSVNACVVGTLLGRKAGLGEDKLKDLSMGLLLHDIGQTTIPPEIVNKPGRFTEDEFELMKTHARAGFDLVRDLPSLSAHTKIVVLQHHERFDGTGYPKGLKGSDIHLFGQIGAIADVYDALTSDCTYHRRLLPHEAIEYLLDSGDRYFPLALVKSLVAVIAPYPIGTVVRLSTGETGVVCKIPKSAAARPSVRLIRDERGRDIAAPLPVVDLKAEPDIAISGVLAD